MRYLRRMWIRFRFILTGECGGICHIHDMYGFVPECGCVIHDI